MPRLFSAILLVIGLNSCASRDYMEVLDLPGHQWASEQAVVFTFEPSGTTAASPISSPPEGESIDLVVRHSEHFPYTDLRLEIKGVAPDKQYWIDTITMPLTTRPSDPNGTDSQHPWAGRRYSNHYDLTRRYRTGIRYPQKGTYSISIRQLSGDDPLRGILSIGIVASGCIHPGQIRH